MGDQSHDIQTINWGRVRNSPSKREKEGSLFEMIGLWTHGRHRLPNVPVSNSKSIHLKGGEKKRKATKDMNVPRTK